MFESPVSPTEVAEVVLAEVQVRHRRGAATHSVAERMTSTSLMDTIGILIAGHTGCEDPGSMANTGVKHTPGTTPQLFHGT